MKQTSFWKAAGRTALLLHRAAAKLTRIEGELIRDAWSNAWYVKKRRCKKQSR